jgi:hypothetical protein
MQWTAAQLCAPSLDDRLLGAAQLGRQLAGSDPQLELGLGQDLLGWEPDPFYAFLESL